MQRLTTQQLLFRWTGFLRLGASESFLCGRVLTFIHTMYFFIII